MSEESVLKHGQCLTDETLTDYLEGALDPAVLAASEVHLAACDACRENLAAFMRLMQTRVTPEEESRLQLVTEAWNRRDLHAIPSSPGRPAGYPGKTHRRGWLIAVAGVAAAALFAAIPTWIAAHRVASEQTPDEILHMLLAQDRPFEAQLAGEPHLAMVRGRTAAGGVDYAVLTEEMTQLSADQYEMGRFYLIQQDFDRAIPNLESAEKDPGAPAAVHNDLGVALMESGGTQNLAAASREFDHALKRNPNFLPAIFNLSIFYDRTGVSSMADIERHRYLQLDSKSGWADEVRLKLGTDR